VVAAEQHAVEIVDLVEDDLGARIEAQQLVAPLREPGAAPRVDAVGVDTPEQADHRLARARRVPGRQQPEQVASPLHGLQDRSRPRELAARIIGDEPQRAPRVRRHAQLRRVGVQPAHRASAAITRSYGPWRSPRSSTSHRASPAWTLDAIATPHRTVASVRAS
jgi:hypothetical protein